jgi:hypothetical protein
MQRYEAHNPCARCVCRLLPRRRASAAPPPGSRRVFAALTRAVASRQRVKTVQKNVASRNSHAVEEVVAAGKVGAGAKVSITDEQLAGTAHAAHAGGAGERLRVCSV